MRRRRWRPPSSRQRRARSGRGRGTGTASRTGGGAYDRRLGGRAGSARGAVRPVAAGRRQRCASGREHDLRRGGAGAQREGGETAEDAPHAAVSATRLRRRLASSTAAAGPRGSAKTARRQGDELDALARRGLDRGEGSAAHDDRRDDEDRRPPGGEVERLVEDRRRRCRRRAGRRTGSRDWPRRRPSPRGASGSPPAPTISFGRSFSIAAGEVGDAAVDVDAVGAGPPGDARIVVDERRDAAGLRARDDAPRQGAAGGRRPPAMMSGGDVAAGERIVDERHKVIGVNVVRRHQAEATAPHFHFGHHLSAADLPAARGLTREGSPAIAPASPSSRRLTYNEFGHLRDVRRPFSRDPASSRRWRRGCSSARGG